MRAILLFLVAALAVPWLSWARLLESFPQATARYGQPIRIDRRNQIGIVQYQKGGIHITATFRAGVCEQIQFQKQSREPFSTEEITLLLIANRVDLEQDWRDTTAENPDSVDPAWILGTDRAHFSAVAIYQQGSATLTLYTSDEYNRIHPPAPPTDLQGF